MTPYFLKRISIQFSANVFSEHLSVCLCVFFPVWFYRVGNRIYLYQDRSKNIGNDQELEQSNATSHPQNQNGKRSIHTNR